MSRTRPTSERERVAAPQGELEPSRGDERAGDGHDGTDELPSSSVPRGDGSDDSDETSGGTGGLDGREAARETSAGWRRALAEPVASGWVDVGVSLLIAAGYLWLLLRTAGTLGYTRDEGWYFQAAQSYRRWFELLWADSSTALEQVDRYWRVNSEHPALLKSLFALSSLAHDRWQWFAMPGTSYRFPAMALSGLGLGVVYLWGTRARGRLVGLVAAVSLGFMPRLFFHAHLACFDAPIVTMWTLCAYAYWRALERGGWLWPIVVGITFGLALDTKHNSWFLPVVCGLHAALVVGRSLLRKLASPGRRLSSSARLRALGFIRRASAALLSMAVIGPAVFYALWPWIWHQTWPRLEAYARFHLDHVYYNMEFLGRNYFEPPMPRGYAPLMTLATVPTILLLLFLIGLVVSVRRAIAPVGADLSSLRHRGGGAADAEGKSTSGSAETGPPDDAPSGEGGATSDGETTPSGLGGGAVGPAPMVRDDGGLVLLWLLAIAVQYAAWLSPTTPIFGGTKHWMTAYPFVALFAGVGLLRAIEHARRVLRHESSRRSPDRGRPARPTSDARPEGASTSWLTRLARRPLLEAVFVSCALLPPITQALHSHPWGLSQYVPLFGGAAGGASLGLNRGFWGHTTGAAAGYLDATAGPHARIYVHDTAGPSWQMMISDGRLRRDLLGVGTIAGADFGLYHHEKHMQGQEYQNWVAFDTARPDFVAGLDGVPVIWVYRRPDPPRRPSGLLRPARRRGAE